MPGFDPRPVDAAISLVNLAPTLLDLGGIGSADRPEYAGQSLLPAMTGKQLPHESILVESPESDGGPLELAWIQGGYKLYFDGATRGWGISKLAWAQDEDAPEVDLDEMTEAMKAALLRRRSDLQIKPAER
jgi:hypothetical protein